MRALKWLDEHFEETILGVLLALISLVSLMQVIIRNIPWIPALTWAEEFCRFCWIWSVFLSLPYTIRKACMLRVSILQNRLGPGGRLRWEIAVEGVNALCMLTLGICSLPVISRIMASAETSPAMQWPMWCVYSVMALGFFGGFIRSVQMIICHASELKGGAD